MEETIGFLGDGAQADECEDFAAGVVVEFRAVPAKYLNADRAALIDIGAVPLEQRRRRVVATVGAPAVRRDLVELWPGSEFATIVSPAAWVSRSAAIGEGTVVAPGSTVSARVEIGRHVLVNIGATISHDVVVGDFSTISPGANLGGRCAIGEGVFVGIGAVVSSDVSVASGAIIGAGAVVIDDIAVQGVYVGVPARLIRETVDWLRVV